MSRTMNSFSLKSALYPVSTSGMGNQNSFTLKNALYPVAQAPQSGLGEVNQLLGNIGSNLEDYVKNSQGVAGLFLPALAQQEQTNAAPILQNQVQTSLDYPPSLLNKLMMASGGIPGVAMAENALGANQTVSPMVPLGAIGKYAQNALKGIPSSSPEEQSISAAFPNVAQEYQKEISPISNFPINQALGIKNTPQNRMAEEGLEQAIPLATLSLGEGGGLLGKTLNIFKRNSAINDLGNKIPLEFDNARKVADQFYSAKDPYNETSLPNFSSKDVPISKPLLLKDGTRFSISDLNNLKNSDPEFYDSLKPLIRQNEGVSNLRSFLGEEDYDKFARNSKLKNEMDDLDKNWNIGNAHDLSKTFNRIGATKSDPAERGMFFNASQRLRDELVKPTLKNTDQNAYDLYNQGDRYYAKYVKPFEATKKLSAISNGLIPNVSKKTVNQEISKGMETASKFNRDPDTGRRLPLIPQDHPYFRPLRYALEKNIRNKKISKMAGATVLGAIGLHKLNEFL